MEEMDRISRFGFLKLGFRLFPPASRNLDQGLLFSSHFYFATNTSSPHCNSRLIYNEHIDELEVGIVKKERQAEEYTYGKGAG